MTRRRHPRAVTVDVIECSPLTYELGDVGRQRLREIWTPDPPRHTEEDPAMSTNDQPVRHYELKQALSRLLTEDGLLQALGSLEVVNKAELDGAMLAMTNAIQAVNDRIDSLYTAVDEVTEQVLAVGTNRIDLNDRMVRFLESHPGVKFPAYAVAENIGHADGRDAGKRLKALANTGRVSVDARPNHRPLYFVKG